MQSLIKNYFTESIQTQIVMAEALSEPITKAANAIIQSLLNGNKIMSCGPDIAGSTVLNFTAQIANGIDMERPCLPAIALVADNVLIATIASSYNQVHEIYSKQIQALAIQGDVLIVLSHDGNHPAIIKAVQEAVIKDMTIIAVTGFDGGSLSGLLAKNDIEIRIPSNKKRTVYEMQAMVLNCLCQLIENTLFIHSEPE